MQKLLLSENPQIDSEIIINTMEIIQGPAVSL